MNRRYAGLVIALMLGSATAVEAQDRSVPRIYESLRKKEAKPVPRTAEEEQLQRFWSAYYRSLAEYYASLEKVDWVAYYKQKGYPIDPRFYNPTNWHPEEQLLVPVRIGVPVDASVVIPAGSLTGPATDVRRGTVLMPEPIAHPDAPAGAGLLPRGPIAPTVPQ